MSRLEAAARKGADAVLAVDGAAHEPSVTHRGATHIGYVADAKLELAGAFATVAPSSCLGGYILNRRHVLGM